MVLSIGLSTVLLPPYSPVMLPTEHFCTLCSIFDIKSLFEVDIQAMNDDSMLVMFFRYLPYHMYVNYSRALWESPDL